MARNLNSIADKLSLHVNCKSIILASDVHCVFLQFSSFPLQFSFAFDLAVYLMPWNFETYYSIVPFELPRVIKHNFSKSTKYKRTCVMPLDLPVQQD